MTSVRIRVHCGLQARHAPSFVALLKNGGESGAGDGEKEQFQLVQPAQIALLRAQCFQVEKWGLTLP